MCTSTFSVSSYALAHSFGAGRLGGAPPCQIYAINIARLSTITHFFKNDLRRHSNSRLFYLASNIIVKNIGLCLTTPCTISALTS